jgi:hypothetical protein
MVVLLLLMVGLFVCMIDLMFRFDVRFWVRLVLKRTYVFLIQIIKGLLTGLIIVAVFSIYLSLQSQ